MGATMDIEDAAAELGTAFVGQKFGATRVISGMAEVGRDAEDEIAIRLFLTLNDPTGATWPHDDVLALRRATLAKAKELGVDVSVLVRVIPQTDKPQEEDDQRLFGT